MAESPRATKPDENGRRRPERPQSLEGNAAGRNNLVREAAQGLNTPGVQKDLFRTSPESRTSSNHQDMAATETKLSKMIEQSKANGYDIERLPNSRDGISEFKVKYHNPDGKITSVDLGLNNKGELVKAGNLLKGADGVWRHNGLGPAHKYQNYSFDTETARYTYQNDRNEGRWIDPDSSSGRVNFSSNGSRAYYGKDVKDATGKVTERGRHEFTLRADGSSWNARTGEITAKEKIETRSDGAKVHFGTDGKADYVKLSDGRVQDQKQRTTTEYLADGGKKVTHWNDGRVVTHAPDGKVTSAGKSQYNQIEYSYDNDKNLVAATKVVEGKRTSVWTKRPGIAETARVSDGGELEITRRDGAKTTIDRQLVTREYDRGDDKPRLITLPNGNSRQITGNIVEDKYRQNGRRITRTLSTEDSHNSHLVTRSVLSSRSGRNGNVSETRQSLPSNAVSISQANGDVQVNIGGERGRSYILPVAHQTHIRQIRNRRR